MMLNGTDKPRWLTGEEAKAAADEWRRLKAREPSVDSEGLRSVNAAAKERYVGDKSV